MNEGYLKHHFDVVRVSLALLVSSELGAAVEEGRGHTGLVRVDRGRRHQRGRGSAGRGRAGAALCTDRHGGHASAGGGARAQRTHGPYSRREDRRTHWWRVVSSESPLLSSRLSPSASALRFSANRAVKLSELTDWTAGRLWAPEQRMTGIVGNRRTIVT